MFQLFKSTSCFHIRRGIFNVRYLIFGCLCSMARIYDLWKAQGAWSGHLLWSGWLSSSSTATPHRSYHNKYISYKHTKYIVAITSCKHVNYKHMIMNRNESNNNIDTISFMIDWQNSSVNLICEWICTSVNWSLRIFNAKINNTFWSNIINITWSKTAISTIQ